MMQYVKIVIKAVESGQERLIALLNEMNATGFEQTEEELTAYFDEASYVSADVIGALKEYSYTIQILQEQNWNALWESNFDPVVIGAFCGIRAQFHPPISHVLHEIIITPKMSFGTGHHATTFMMIEQMQHIYFYDKAVLDFGTGTGILAILAERLGASLVTAIDIDLWSIDNAKENIEHNSCKNIRLIHSSSLPHSPYDIVLANINKNIILASLPALKACTSENGFLILSGLLEGDEAEIRGACLEHGLTFVSGTTKSKWILLMFTNSRPDLVN